MWRTLSEKTNEFSRGRARNYANKKIRNSITRRTIYLKRAEIYLPRKTQRYTG
jgi:hypothetical protein